MTEIFDDDQAAAAHELQAVLVVGVVVAFVGVDKRHVEAVVAEFGVQLAEGLGGVQHRRAEIAFGLGGELPRCMHVMGKRFVSAFCAVKEAEYVEYARVISPWERRYLLLHV